MTENEISEGAVKEALSTLSQQKMLEFFQRGLLLEANLVVARNESEQLLNNINDLQGEIDDLKTSANEGATLSPAEPLVYSKSTVDLP